jgi:hypothetical protein
MRWPGAERRGCAPAAAHHSRPWLRGKQSSTHETLERPEEQRRVFVAPVPSD